MAEWVEGPEGSVELEQGDVEEEAQVLEVEEVDPMREKWYSKMASQYNLHEIHVLLYLPKTIGL